MRSTLMVVTVAGALLLPACSSGGGESAGTGGDQVPPLAGSVADGLAADIDLQTSTTTISANWSGFSDGEGPIAYYEWCIGTSVGGGDVQAWVSTDQSTSATNSSLALQTGVRYHVSVRAYDSASNVSAVSSSDGVELGNTAGGSGPMQASSVSQWGITWTFDREYTVGQFCNGDWWVVGPVTIVDITPRCQDLNGRIINGSMVNPPTTGRHGYDSTLYGSYSYGEAVYDSRLNVALNLSRNNTRTLPPSTSLISCISQIGTPSTPSASQLQTAAVLTVLEAVAPLGAFRPPYSGTNKTLRYSEGQINYGALAMLAPASSAPDIQQTATKFSRVWLDHCASWTSSFMHPVENMPHYYRDFTTLTGTAGLLLNCSYSITEKRHLLIGFLQLGIDNFGNILNGARWYVNGHCNGRKFPILFAGRMLDDPEMSAVGTTYPTVFYGPGDPRNTTGAFSEDGQTFYVQETSPGVYNWGYGNYNSGHVDMPEWGNAHTVDPSTDSSSWENNPYRRCCSANGWVGVCLTMRIMGIQHTWNQQAWFDYMDRYTQIENAASWTFSWDPWHSEMWLAYRPQF